MKVLLLNDQPEDTLLVGSMLSDYQVASLTLKSAENLDSSVILLASEKPDLIILDLSRLESQPLVILNTLNVKTPHLPIIVLTTNKDEQIALAAIQAGAQDYLIKGQFDKSTLIRSMHYALERKQVEQRLQGVAERMQMALDSARIGTWSWLINVNKVIWDKHMENLFAFDKKGLPKSHEDFIACIHPDDQSRIANEILAAIAEDRKYEAEFRIIWPDQTLHMIASRGKVYRNEEGDPIRMAGVCWDITKRKLAEQALQEVTDHLNFALKAAKVGIWNRDILTNIAFWDEHMEALFGFTKNSFPGTYAAFLQRVHPDDYKRVDEHIRSAIANKSGIELEYRIVWPDGSVHVLSEKGEVYSNSAGEPIRITGVCWDITEKKLAEQALRESEEKYRSLVEMTHDWIWAVDAQGCFIYSNPSVFPMLGYTADEIIGIHNLSLVHPEDLAELNKLIPEWIKKKQAWKNQIIRMRHKDGGYRYHESNAVPIVNIHGDVIGYRGADRDITERKQTEKWLRQHQLELAQVGRMTSMGEMASALAHELNQPLAAITNYTKGCVRRLQSGNYQVSDLQYAMRQAAQQAARAGEIIHRIKNFMRKGELYQEMVNLNDLIIGTVTFIDYEIRDIGLNISYELDEHLPLLELDKVQIEQVIMNLLNNSIDAIREAKIEKPQLILRSQYKDKSLVLVDVIDNGPGFLPDSLKKLFNPYFTTKPKGMGMGLSICRTIVEAHGGNLTAQANPAGGAWFQITLPVNQ